MSSKHFFATDHFVERHIGTSPQQVAYMLQQLNVDTLDELINQTVPPNIQLTAPLEIGDPMSEYQYLQHIQQLMSRNQVWKSYIGMGYYGTIVPAVIQRNIFENPGWYTQYTPYQAEIAQGRLEALLNFQTVICDLTNMPVANASLLDEATAAAEAMQMLHRTQNKNPRAPQNNTFLVADNCLPATIEVLKTRAEPLGIEVKVRHFSRFNFADDGVFACLLQYPAQDGAIHNYQQLTQNAHNAGVKVVVATDLLSLCLLTPPGDWGADVVIGNSQRFGVPMGYGGPHAAFFATRDEFVRQMPGRIIGASVDRQGKTALRMALQTREQHIRRDKATSNICTAQALLAIMAGMYAVYHGADGLKRIAIRIHVLTATLNQALENLGYKQLNEHFFDTLLIDLSQHTNTSGLRVRRVAELEQINLRYFDNEDLIGISIDETCTLDDVVRIVNVFAEADNQDAPELTPAKRHFPETLHRHSEFLTHPVFNTHRSETQLLRYIKQLENKDLSLAFGMIPLGSCTMKLNATTQLMPLSFANFAHLHPFVPLSQTGGYQAILKQLSLDLANITGFDACSLQPNSGAQGEYAGLMVIRAYHLSNNQPQRRIALIPQSAHGTNPASAVMAGMEVVVVKCDENGNIDVPDLQQKAQTHANTLACLMVTYPSTHGVFEEAITDICQIIHQYGGQVYMDGANMNAQVGLTNPATIGADVCHLNLHKTFAIPHGGGGPGMGPICVAKHLTPFLPSHIYLKHQTNSQAISAVSAAPYGSASILLISYAYIKLLGSEGLTQATKIAILNANYIKKRLETEYQTLYVGKNGRVAHELIIDVRPFKQSAGIEAEDIAKRLIDYGFHAPTVSFPVAGTLMIEPTESEDLDELDRFCNALLSIRHEIREIELGIAYTADNVLKNAPHPINEITADYWQHSYSRQKAAYPLPALYKHKFWAPVARVNNTTGDRNLICTCPPIEMYEA